MATKDVKTAFPPMPGQVEIKKIFEEKKSLAPWWNSGDDISSK